MDEDISKFPLLEIFSRDIKLNESLVQKIDAILEQRLKNEMYISYHLYEGMEKDKIDMTSAINLHNRGKDSISDLIRIKQLLGGLPTENKAVVHTFDKWALLDAVREARKMGEGERGVGVIDV